MRRVAIFAEGLTEIIFIQRLIEEIGDRNKIAFETRSLRGNKFSVMQSTPIALGQTNTFVLLVNCNNDERVKSALLDQRESLEKSGYSYLIGLRDLYPLSLSDLGLVESRLQYGVPTKGIPTRLLLSVSEVEAWFVQESTHFERIHPDFTVDYIKSLTGFDIASVSADLIIQPSKLIDDVYSSRGLRYAKKKNQIQRTVSALDFAALYLTCSTRLPHLARFVNCIEEAIL
jgi:hypothetical protein